MTVAAVRFPNGTERRAAAELRAAAGRHLVGHAAVFGTAAKIGGFTETIQAGAFASTLATGGDVLALVDHDPAALLGRTSSGTLQLREDAKGLAFDIALPDTALARDLLALAERGDLGGASFAFRVVKEAWPSADRRILQAVQLIEISVVRSWPAYAETDVSARSREAAAVSLALRRRIAGIF